MGSLICLAHLFSIAFKCSYVVSNTFVNGICNDPCADVYKVFLSFKRCFGKKSVNFVMILVWIYTKYCLLESVILKKTMIYERFVCFDLSKQIRWSTLSYKVFILFPLKIYPFTGYKQKVRFCTRNSRILTFDFGKNEKGLP